MNWASLRRGRLGARAVLPALVASMLVSCGGSGTSSRSADPSHVKSATAWASELQAANLGCKDPRPNPSLGQKPTESVRCTVGNENVAFFRWKNHATTVSIVSTTKSQACSFAKQYGLDGIVVVYGDNWTASPHSASTGQKIASATHGKSDAITC